MRLELQPGLLPMQQPALQPVLLEKTKRPIDRRHWTKMRSTSIVKLGEAATHL
jgi:hypothetical protein